jgi:DNA-directed RNA polymerase specialized sigma24 family protein
MIKPQQTSIENTVIPKKKNYLNNKDLLAEVVKSKAQQQMSDKLALMLTMLCKKYAKRGNFANYSYNDDMQGYAMLMLVKTWNSFDPAKSNNPFAFFTQCIKNSFIQYLNHEKTQRDIKNETLIAAGMNPSYGYSSTLEERHDLLSSDDVIAPTISETIISSTVIDTEISPV